MVLPGVSGGVKVRRCVVVMLIPSLGRMRRDMQAWPGMLQPGKHGCRQALPFLKAYHLPYPHDPLAFHATLVCSLPHLSDTPPLHIICMISIPHHHTPPVHYCVQRPVILATYLYPSPKHSPTHHCVPLPVLLLNRAWDVDGSDRLGSGSGWNWELPEPLSPRSHFCRSPIQIHSLPDSLPMSHHVIFHPLSILTHLPYLGLFSHYLQTLAGETNVYSVASTTMLHGLHYLTFRPPLFLWRTQASTTPQLPTSPTTPLFLPHIPLPVSLVPVLFNLVLA